MPAKNNAPGANKKKKKGRKPVHQNTFAYQHNPKSKKTEKILSSPNEGCCQRCYEKIEWRKKYRKYKPLTQPSTCNICKRRNVTRAYHTICQGCTTSETAYGRLEQNLKESTKSENTNDSNLTEQISESNEGKNTKLFSGRVCAICVKEPVRTTQAIIDRGEAEEIEEKLAAGHDMKLRERRALERKLEKLRKEEKERKKLERQQLDAPSQEIDADESENSHHHSDMDVDDSEENKSDNEDELLKAVGGKDKLLTGEAYRQMLLKTNN
jgi:hypothetical protein